MKVELKIKGQNKNKIQKVIKVSRLIDKMDNSGKKQKSHSFLVSHPQITKKVTISSPHIKQKPSIPQQEYHRIRSQLYSLQQQLSATLQQKSQTLQHQNELIGDSLTYFNPELALQQLQRELQQIKQEDSLITVQISNCQMIEQNTTPQEYFLFKKNKRLETFDEAMDALFDEVNKEREEMKKVMQEIKRETGQVNQEIEEMEREMYRKQQQESHDKNNHQDDHSQVQESRVQLQIQSSIHSDQQFQQATDSDSGSSVDLTQLTQLKQQHKTLLQTFEILQQNNQILSHQLINNIPSIQQSLTKYYETQKSKLFRQIMQLKEDFEYMPVQHIIPPSETELNYHVDPLIMDYRNRMTDLGKKLSGEMKSVVIDVIEPLRWDQVNFDQYLDSPKGKQFRQSQASLASRKQTLRQTKTLKQTQLKYDKLQGQLIKQDQQIAQLQANLQEIMGETMIYKQKQHQLELAMNNMRKMIREQEQVF